MRIFTFACSLKSTDRIGLWDGNVEVWVHCTCLLARILVNSPIFLQRVLSTTGIVFLQVDSPPLPLPPLPDNERTEVLTAPQEKE